MARVSPVLHTEVISPRADATIPNLYSVAHFVDDTRPVMYGVDVLNRPVGGHGLWPDACEPGDRTKTGAEAGRTVRFPGTAVWAAEECAAVGLSEAEAVSIARARLEAVESVEAERHTAGVLKERAVAGDSVAAAEAMLLAEGFAPVVHVRPTDVPRLLDSRALMSVGGAITTPLGSTVAIGAGYETELDGVYVTGAVTILRNEVEEGVAFSPVTNERLAIAERPLAVTWVGPVIKVAVVPAGEG